MFVQAPLTITANSVSKTYGQTATINASIGTDTAGIAIPGSPTGGIYLAVTNGNATIGASGIKSNTGSVSVYSIGNMTVNGMIDTRSTTGTGGGNITREAGPVKGGSTIIAFVTDPDGYKIELIQRP